MTGTMMILVSRIACPLERLPPGPPPSSSPRSEEITSEPLNTFVLPTSVENMRIRSAEKRINRLLFVTANSRNENVSAFQAFKAQCIAFFSIKLTIF